MASFTFLADDLNVNMNGSGLGFFGSSFGSSVVVGAYQDTTWITDGNGTLNGGPVENVKYVHPQSGVCSSAGTTPYLLSYIPNRLATLNIRFEHSSAVKLQNTKLRIYDRSNINNGPSGVLCKVAQIVHPGSTLSAGGSGDATWETPTGSSTIMTLDGSPGVSGVHGLSTTHTSTQHDFYLNLSSSPSSVGSKTQFALYCETEYL